MRADTACISLRNARISHDYDAKEIIALSLASPFLSLGSPGRAHLARERMRVTNYVATFSDRGAASSTLVLASQAQRHRSGYRHIAASRRDVATTARRGREQ